MKEKEMKIKAKNILVPVIIFIIIGIICWSWVLIGKDDVLSALKFSVVVAILQWCIVRINDREFTSIDFLGKLSIFLWIVSFSSGFTGVVPIVWIAITAIFYIVSIHKNLKVMREIRERRNRLYK
jgi:ABC-type siderophore export system fused ATPase/permease subunit